MVQSVRPQTATQRTQCQILCVHPIWTFNMRIIQVVDARLFTDHPRIGRKAEHRLKRSTSSGIRTQIPEAFIAPWWIPTKLCQASTNAIITQTLGTLLIVVCMYSLLTWYVLQQYENRPISSRKIK